MDYQNKRERQSQKKFPNRSICTSVFLSLLCGMNNGGAKAQMQTDIDRGFNQSVVNLAKNLSLESNGAVIASPSTSAPNYYYHWIRDGALTMSTVADLAVSPKISADWRRYFTQRLETWVHYERRIQNARSLTGLGEPRFFVNGDANFDPWGRPQNDGPALRAITAIKIARLWLAQGKRDAVSRLLYKAELPANTFIKKDLEYVASHYQKPSFDLWEEESGFHLYTLAVQARALDEGARLADDLGDPEAARHYRAHAQSIRGQFDQFYLDDGYRYAINHFPKPEKKLPWDIAVVLAQNHASSGARALLDQGRVKGTVQKLRTDFNRIYGINKISTNSKGMALGTAFGRYPEDVYSGVDFSGASPWFLATLAVAENECRFPTHKSWKSLANGLFHRVLTHQGENGAMAEQFNRSTGFQQGAAHLTWSYSAYITAYLACYP